MGPWCGLLEIAGIVPLRQTRFLLWVLRNKNRPEGRQALRYVLMM
jgi:hypothetical protein